MGHHNVFYTPFWYFPSFLLVFLTVSVGWRAVAVPVFVLLLFVPQYAVAYVWGHRYSYARQGELQVARSAIASRGTDLSHAHIFGDFIFWPVFKDLSFEWSPSFWFNQRSMPRGTSYLICGLDPPFSPQELFAPTSCWFSAICSSLSSFPGRAETISYTSGASEEASAFYWAMPACRPSATTAVPVAVYQPDTRHHLDTLSSMSYTDLTNR
jgi:hypothetical protein